MKNFTLSSLVLNSLKSNTPFVTSDRLYGGGVLSFNRLKISNFFSNFYKGSNPAVFRNSEFKNFLSSVIYTDKLTSCAMEGQSLSFSLQITSDSCSSGSISLCTFTSCKSLTTGGALSSNVAYTITSSTFISCGAEQEGGAIYVLSELTLEDCVFSSCTSTVDGAAIYASSTSQTVSISNIIVHSGSGNSVIYLDTDTSILDTVLIERNQTFVESAIIVTKGVFTTNVTTVLCTLTTPTPVINTTGATTVSLSNTRIEDTGTAQTGAYILASGTVTLDAITIETAQTTATSAAIEVTSPGTYTFTALKYLTTDSTINITAFNGTMVAGSYSLIIYNTTGTVTSGTTSDVSTVSNNASELFISWPDAVTLVTATGSASATTTATTSDIVAATANPTASAAVGTTATTQSRLSGLEASLISILVIVIVSGIATGCFIAFKIVRRKTIDERRDPTISGFP